MLQDRQMGKLARTLGLAVVVAFCGAVAARADVTIKQTSTSKGMGGILDAEIKSENCIKGDRSCSDMESRLTGKLMKFLGGGKPIKTSSIMRLDQDVMFQVNHQDKSYTEMTFEQMRAMMDSLKLMTGGQPKGAPQPKPAIDTSEVTFAPPTFDIKKTGVKETIAGYPCEQSILTMTVEGTNKKTKDTFKMITTMDMMLTLNMPGKAEYEAFGKKMAEKMGTSMEAAGAQSMMQALGAYGIDAKKLAEESAKIQGFPMRQVIRFAGEGKQFAASESKEPQGSESANKEEESNSKDPAAKVLGGLFGKKKDNKEKVDSSKEKPDNAIFKMTTEVTEISTSALSETRFEVPAGYNKQAPGKK